MSTLNTMELPPGCRTRKKFSKRPMHLLLASVHGRLSLFITEIPGIAMRKLKPDSSGSAATWSRHLVIDNQEIKRQTGLEESYNLRSPHFRFHGFGERSGSMIMSLDKRGQIFRLDIGTMEDRKHPLSGDSLAREVCRSNNRSTDCSCTRQISSLCCRA